jgi:hypothetical protein
MSYFSHWDHPEVKFEELVGKTLTEISGGVGDDRLEFKCSDGSVYVMYHSQDCCESVSVESIAGDFADLIGSPILKAEEATNSETPEGYKHDYEPESQTWTFYKLATIKGYVDIRWFGSSNGYYSEGVDFLRLVDAHGVPVLSQRQPPLPRDLDPTVLRGEGTGTHGVQGERNV